MNSPLRLGLVCRSLVKSKGGHEKYLHRLINYGLKQNLEITAFCESADGLPDSPRFERVNVPTFRFEQGLRHWSFNYNARKLTSKHSDQFDVLFTTGKVNFGDIHRAGGGVHKRYLDQCGDWTSYLKPKTWVQLTLQRQLYEHCQDTRFIVNSNMVKQQVIEEFDVPEDRLQVIYNGVDTDRFKYEKLKNRSGELREQYDLNRDDFLCLYTGAKWKRKGLPELLEALVQIKQDHVKLVIIGNVKQNKLNSAVNRLDLSNRVIYKGYTEHIEQFYGMADLLVFPSRYDAGANVVPEALASGLPVITTSMNGTHELIEEPAGKVIDNATRIDQMKRYILQFVRDHPYPERRRKAAQIGQQYTMERHFNQMIDQFHKASHS
ncbi:MAG: glycosyltransferase family 4 protein [bacterium]